MSSSPSVAQIRSKKYRSLDQLAKRLRGDFGLTCSRQEDVLAIIGANVRGATYRLLRASNGECCLLPRIVYQDGTSEEGFGVFYKIKKVDRVF